MPQDEEPLVTVKIWMDENATLQTLIHADKMLGEMDEVALILAALAGRVHGQARDALTEQRPMLNGDVLEEMAAADARLTIIHTLLHLPDSSVSGFTT